MFEVTKTQKRKLWKNKTHFCVSSHEDIEKKTLEKVEPSFVLAIAKTFKRQPWIHATSYCVGSHEDTEKKTLVK